MLLKWAWPQYEYHKVESDSKIAIDIINGKAKHPWNCTNTIKDIMHLAHHFQEARFTHAWREANRAAYFLAKQPKDHPHFCSSHIHPSQFPSFLNLILEEDKQGVQYTRMSLVVLLSFHVVLSIQLELNQILGVVRFWIYNHFHKETVQGT